MEKTSLLPQSEPSEQQEQQQPPRSHVRPTRYHGLAFILLLGLFFLSTPSSFECTHKRHSHHGHQNSQNTSAKVPLEVHIMSKCPDARDCLEKLVVPTMANVSEKVDFKLSYIGRTTEEDDGVQCMHGQTECLGNIVELCAAAEYPSPELYLGFTMCLERDYAQLPKQAFIEGCALEHGISFERLNDCMSKDDGAYGMGLLRDSVTRSKEAGVSTSCTVRLAGKVRCVRDGGKWRDCEGGSGVEDLIGDIEKAFKD